MTQVFPEQNTVFDFYWSTEEKSFNLWNTLYANFEIDNKLQYHEIMIPNIDSTRNTYVTDMLIKQSYHVLCPGTTGTGKSMNIYKMLNCMGDTF